MPTEEQIGLDRFSPSQLDMYEGCPKLFYYRVFLGLQADEDSRHFAFGTAIHAALENLYIQYDDNFGGAWEAADKKEYLKAFTDRWKIHHIGDDEFKRFLETKKGKESGYKKKEELYNYMKADGLAILKEYWDKKEWLLTEYGIDGKDTELYKRIQVTNPLDPTEKLPIPMSMRIDITYKDGAAGDFKTSGGNYNPKEAREKIQGLCYTYALYAESGKVNHFDYIVLKKGMKTDGNRIQVVRLEYDKEDLAAWYQRVKSILQRIANREFDAPSVGHSPWCDCRKFDKLLDISNVK